MFNRALGMYYLLCYFRVMYFRRGAGLLLIDWYIDGSVISEHGFSQNKNVFLVFLFN